MCTTLLEVCTRKGDTARALAIYNRMRDAPPGSRLAPSVHAFTSAMRAAADGGAWERALEIWNDMIAAGCQPTGAFQGPIHASDPLKCLLLSTGMSCALIQGGTEAVRALSNRRKSSQKDSQIAALPDIPKCHPASCYSSKCACGGCRAAYAAAVRAYGSGQPVEARSRLR
jgi:pentatricopeptide repeat protein